MRSEVNGTARSCLACKWSALREASRREAQDRALEWRSPLRTNGKSNGKSLRARKGGDNMNKARREFIVRVVGTIGAVGVIVAAPSPARACLAGKWKVRCPRGHDDIVEDVTCNHACEKCGAKAFSDGVGDVVCPDGHANHVSTGNRNERDKWLQRLKCSKCGKECCIEPYRR